MKEGKPTKKIKKKTIGVASQNLRENGGWERSRNFSSSLNKYIGGFISCDFIYNNK